MEYNYDFYIASAIVLLIVLIYRISVPKVNNLENRMFDIFLTISLFCCLSDMVSGGILMQKFPKNVGLNYFGQMTSYCFQHLVPVAYFLYMQAFIRKFPKFPRSVLAWILPGAFVQVIVWTTPLTGWAFTYTKEKGYVRGPLLVIFVFIAIFYLGAAFLEVYKAEKGTERHYSLFTLFFLLVSLLLIAVQMIEPKYVLLGASSAMGGLIMQLTLQNPKMIKEATEREAEARIMAEEASRAKSTFLANMSHEIRTPMNAICGMAEVLSRSSLNPIEQDYVQTIQDAGKRLLRIIDDILDFSKIDAGKTELILEEYNFPELLSETEKIIAARLQKKDIFFEVNLGENIPQILKGDQGKVHQILINILGNAVKFTNNGRITLEVTFHIESKDKMRIVFLVTDTGIGIRKEDMDKLFNQFSQVDVARNRKIEGSGLGLILSKGLANLMNGDITVTSEYGIGSSFRIEIEQELVKLMEEIDRQQLETYRVYIYEADYDTRYYLSHLMAQMGITPMLITDVNRLQKLQEETSDTDKIILFYSYEKYYSVVKGYHFPFRAVALLEYHTAVGDSSKITYFMRKPFDIFKILKVFEMDNQILEKKPQYKEVVISNARVAVVDDNKVNLRVIATLLRELGVMPETFSSGENIIRAIEKGREYDIIFMDHMMPVMDGIETTQKIRNMKGKYVQKAIIIALTANAIDGVENEYKSAGMNDWLFKPVNLVRLQEKLIEYLPAESVTYQ